LFEEEEEEEEEEEGVLELRRSGELVFASSANTPPFLFPMSCKQINLT
jgi:hypothetical protein